MKGILLGFAVLLGVSGHGQNGKLYDRDSLAAVNDITRGTLHLICGGGFISVANTKKDREFEKKYHVQYDILGCVMPSMESITAYNKVVADYLDKRYGKAWRADLRRDVHGITKNEGM